MTRTNPTTRAHEWLSRLEDWAHRGRVRAVVVKVGVSILGPLVVLAGVAMTVLPGPGLVVVALGLGLLALEYEWARAVLRRTGRAVDQARRATLPTGATAGRRAAGVLAAGAFVAATTLLTAGATAYLGAFAIY
jgi:uncharacterized protein (TIGR02611 family)